jgi:hypothetical protein
MEIGIFYNWQPHNKINGSLFYAYEYARLLQDLSIQTQTKIHFFITSLKPLTQKDKDLIFTAFDLKYEGVDNSFIKFSSITGSYFTSGFLTKALFLDVKSYNTISKFLPGIEKHLYCNHSDNMEVDIFYPGNLYYWYEEYQTGKYKTKLKLYFGIHKVYPETENEAWFVSSVSAEDQIGEYLPEVYVFKKHKIMLNIYKDFQKIMYIHNGNRDTNNRLIPEAIYFGKELKIKWTQEVYKNDSVFERYIDITENGINDYILDESDLIIQKLLKKDLE